MARRCGVLILTDIVAGFLCGALILSPRSPLEAQLPPGPERAEIGSGPFGLPMGATLTQLKVVDKLVPVPNVPGSYLVRAVPKPHGAFESYVLAISETSGLCKIAAIGKDIESSSFGTEIQSAFAALDQALQEKYGNRKNFDFLRAGSIWDEPKDWMMGLLKKERVLSSYWDKEEGSVLRTT